MGIFVSKLLFSENLNLENQQEIIDNLFKYKNKLKKLKPLKILNSNPYFLLEDESIRKLEQDYYKDINNENQLVLLLEAYEKKIGNNEDKIEIFQLFLLKYFDVLSNVQKKRFTNLDIQSNIQRFYNFLNFLYKKEYELIKKNEPYFIGLHDLSGRDLFIKSNKFKIKSLKEKFLNLDKMGISEEEKAVKKNILLEVILKDKKKAKISFYNKELFFAALIKYYYNIIIEEGNKKMKEIGFVATIIKTMIDISIEKIKKVKIEDENEIKTLIMIFSLPLICNDLTSLIKLNSNYDFEKKEKIFSHIFEEKEDELIIKKDNKIIIKLKNKNIWNKDYIDKDFQFLNINDLKEIDFLGYVKLNYFQKYNFFNYDEKIKIFNYGLTKYILQSKTFKTLFSYIHSEIKFNIDTKDNNYIFDDDKVIQEYFNSIIYVPCKLESYSYTLKDFLLVLWKAFRLLLLKIKTCLF